MATSYYIFKSGRLRRKHNTIYLEAESGNEIQRLVIPVENVRDMFVFGEIDFNTKLLSFLGQKGIVIHFFNYHEFYVGSFYPRESNVSGFLLLKQVEHYLDPYRRLNIAKQFVMGALYHMRRNMNYYHNRGKDLQNEIEIINECERRVTTCDSIPELMSEKGRARAVYYSAFNKILELGFTFSKRVKRPPDNFVNAMISFGNSLIYAVVLSELYVTQLNPTISYLHEPSERRFSLALDLAEIFKPLIVDKVIFRLLNLNVISEEDFYSIGEASAVYLKEKACKKFIKTFEETLQTTIKHRKLKRHVSYRQLIRLEAYKLIRHLLGMEEYKVLKAWW